MIILLMIFGRKDKLVNNKLIFPVCLVILTFVYVYKSGLNFVMQSNVLYSRNLILIKAVYALLGIIICKLIINHKNKTPKL